MPDRDLELLRQLEEVATSQFDGHLSILRFTTNWRIGFWTPDGRGDIQAMPVGTTFAAAAEAALAAPQAWHGPYCDLCGERLEGHDVCPVNEANKHSLAELERVILAKGRE